MPVPEIKGPESVRIGESLILECIAEGFPDVRVVWIPPPTSSVAEVEGRGSAILRIPDVSADEAGVYTCFVYTDVDEYHKTVTITGIIIIIIIIITEMIFVVLSSWQSHCKSSPGSYDECRLSAEVAANPKTQPTDLDCESAGNGSYHPHPPSPFIITQP